MLSRRPPASLLFLAGLIAACFAAAIAAGAAMYLETSRTTETQANAVTRGDWRSGKIVVARYNCGSCHVIAGIDGATGRVGPDLDHIGQRVTIAGRLPNDPDTMVRWLMHPQRLQPGNGMPELGLSEREARDATAFLYARQ